MIYFDYDKPAKLGTELLKADQKEVLAAFVHRYTGDHKPHWARKEWKDGQPYPIQFKDDNDWLANTRFQVNKRGELTACGECHSTPTWPNNPELRKGK